MADLSLVIDILLQAVIFIISLSIVVLIPFVKRIENTRIKTIAYIGLGLVAFILVGFAFNLWQPQNAVIASDILVPYTQFYPMLILALALSATVLITYLEKDNYSLYFAGMGFAVLLPYLYTYLFVAGRYDLALLNCALWAVIPVVWAFLWKENTLMVTTAGEKVVTSLKAAFVTYPVYLLTAIISVFGDSKRGVDLTNLTTGIQGSTSQIIMFIAVTIWLFFLISIIIVSLMFVIHDLVLHLFGYRRVCDGRGVRYERIPPASSGRAAPPKPKIDHYAGLIQEMEVFGKHMEDVDRIRAASTIGRFKSEYLTLAAKYNEDSKSSAEKVIKTIEQEFMKKY
jgi:hypothetical protein